MKRSLPTYMALVSAIATSALVSACDGGSPRCEPIVTCEPVCDPGELCSASFECVPVVACDPPTCGTGEICNFENGECVAAPPTCDPACESDEFCDEGTCRALPVCDPACETGEFCTDE